MSANIHKAAAVMASKPLQLAQNGMSMFRSRLGCPMNYTRDSAPRGERLMATSKENGRLDSRVIESRESE